MFDLNTIINQALAIAVAQAVEPLVKRIEELEAKQAQPQPTTPLDKEWFCEKIRSYIDAGVEVALEDHTGKYDHDDFILRGDLAELVKDTVGDFDDFVRKDDLPDFDDYITKADYPDADDLVTKDELPEFPDTDELVTKDEVNELVDEALSDIRIVRR